MNLAQERAASEARRAEEFIKWRARSILNQIGWTSSPEEIRAAAEERWGKIEDAGSVVDAACRIITEEEAETRHLSVKDFQEEDQMSTKNDMAKKIDEATRAVLTSSPLISAGAAYLVVRDRTGMPNKESGWTVSYYYPIKKELRKAGVVPSEALPPKKKAGTSASEVKKPATKPPATPPEAVEIPGAQVTLKEEAVGDTRNKVDPSPFEIMKAALIKERGAAMEKVRKINDAIEAVHSLIES